MKEEVTKYKNAEEFLKRYLPDVKFTEFEKRRLESILSDEVKKNK